MNQQENKATVILVLLAAIMIVTGVYFLSNK